MYKEIVITLILMLTLAIIFLFYEFIYIGKENELKNYRKVHLTITDNNKKQKAELDAYVADSLRKKIKGLMYVEDISYNEGMLFPMGNGTHKFWMKNVKFSIDAMGIDNKGRIVDIKKMETCENGNCINYLIKGEYVLEVKGGYVEKYKIEIGDTVKGIEKI